MRTSLKKSGGENQKEASFLAGVTTTTDAVTATSNGHQEPPPHINKKLVRPVHIYVDTTGLPRDDSNRVGRAGATENTQQG